MNPGSPRHARISPLLLSSCSSTLSTSISGEGEVAGGLATSATATLDDADLRDFRALPVVFELANTRAGCRVQRWVAGSTAGRATPARARAADMAMKGASCAAGRSNWLRGRRSMLSWISIKRRASGCRGLEAGRCLRAEAGGAHEITLPWQGFGGLHSRTGRYNRVAQATAFSPPTLPARVYLRLTVSTRSQLAPRCEYWFSHDCWRVHASPEGARAFRRPAKAGAGPR